MKLPEVAVCCLSAAEWEQGRRIPKQATAPGEAPFEVFSDRGSTPLASTTQKPLKIKKSLDFQGFLLFFSVLHHRLHKAKSAFLHDFGNDFGNGNGNEFVRHSPQTWP